MSLATVGDAVRPEHRITNAERCDNFQLASRWLFTGFEDGNWFIDTQRNSACRAQLPVRLLLSAGQSLARQLI